MANQVIDRLKDVVDPDTLLTSLGFDISISNGREIRCPCAIHGGDNKTSFSFKKDVKRFYCYSHGCEFDDNGEINNDIISLVMRTNNCSFMAAVKYLSQLTGITIDLNNINEVEETRYRKSKEKDKFIKHMSKSEELPEVSEDLLQRYVSNGAEYFRGLGISDEVIKIFELGTYTDHKGVVRGSVPIRDDMGRLVSISGRRVDGDEEPRYRLLYEFQKSDILYNLNNALNFKDVYNDTIIIVEGFKALWAVFSCGFPNVVAVMGKSISSAQINLLVKHGFLYTLLLLDGDKAGVKGTIRSEFFLEGKMTNTSIYLPDEKSPDNYMSVELYELLELFYGSLGG